MTNLFSSRLKIAGILTILFFVIMLVYMAFPARSRARVAPITQSGSSKKKQRAFVPGHVLVRYRSEALARRKTGASQMASATGQLMSLRVERFDGSNLVEGLRLAKVEPADTLRAVAALRNQPDVLYAEPDYILHAAVTTPNDTYFANLYGLTKVGAPLAWDINKGSSSVVVGVVDEGIDINHLDLQPNIWTNPSPGSIPGITGDLHGYNFVSNTGTVFSGDDAESHATHVAGIIGAAGNNNKGVVGVNWNVSLMSLKFLGDTGGTTSDAIRACNYAKQMRDLWLSSGQTQGANIRVLNGSFGSQEFSQAFEDSINQLNISGILFVVAAGNVDDGSATADNDLVPMYPSSFNAPNILSVAATNQTDALTFFSHFGAASVDLGAPGEQILSTTPPCTTLDKSVCDPQFTDSNGDTYSVFRGTSMSAPHVSGAAALLWAQNPNLTVQQVKSLLLLNGDAVPALIGTTLSGRRLNVFKSLLSLAFPDAVAPGAVTNFHIDSQNGRTFNLGWNASGDDGATGQASLYEISFTDASSGKVYLLKGVIPGTSGNAQTTQVITPYRHVAGTLTLNEFDEVGNAGTPVTLNVTIPDTLGDPYITSLASPGTLTTGGQLQALNADDVYADYILPTGFVFPFFGTNYTSLIISSNGNLFFSDAPTRRNGDADDPPATPKALGGYQMIAG
ncbi:MAG TPA: S8 family peptidase, partial [Pyrinomonadaceae bacterium]|nr:S8 family peptidase [Pyrinomonadaceae bacterium]